MVSCAFISCVNTLPSFLLQLQHLPAAEGKAEAVYLQRTLTGGQKHQLAVLRSALRGAVSVTGAKCGADNSPELISKGQGQGAQSSVPVRAPGMGSLPRSPYLYPSCLLSVESRGSLFLNFYFIMLVFG